MFDAQTRAAIEKVAAAEGIEAASLLAISWVESAGRVFASINARLEPLIRFEGHKFYDRLTGSKRERAVREGLAHPKAGRVKNPRSQAARWEMLDRAMAIDADAALESVSWGLGQVMGYHWKRLGYMSVRHMVKRAREGAGGQVELMVRYIKEFGLLDELERKDWTAFARGYNGPAFAKNAYHTKMAEAYERFSGRAPMRPASSGMLRMGSVGPRVRELQALLGRAGFPVKVDGDFGPSTKAALQAFQRANGLKPDGVAGPKTLGDIARYRQSTEEKPGAQSPADVKEVREGVGSAVGGAAAVETARQTIEQAVDQTIGLGWIHAALTVLLVVVVLGGLAYAVIGFIRSRRDKEGDEAIRYADNDNRVDTLDIDDMLKEAA